MSLFAAWVVYPFVLLALCAGIGLLGDALCGRRVPGALIPPLGLAGIVVVGQFTTLSGKTAELTVPLLLALAIAGAGLSLPWRFGRLDRWALAVAIAVFAVFAAPVVLSGEPSFACSRLACFSCWTTSWLGFAGVPSATAMIRGPL